MPYQILPGFRVKLAKNSRQNHWLGGPVLHKGAQCRVCDRPLLLLWDLDCADPRFQLQGRTVFKRLKRLPLYYCWKCGGEFDYQVSASDRFKLLRQKGSYQGDGFPYPNYPICFERKPIDLGLLARIPKAAKQALEADSFKDVPTSAKLALEKWLGRSVEDEYDNWGHQFGGRPWLAQGKEKFVCANKRCSWHRRRRAMKVLASIINDPPGGLPMLESMEQVKKAKGFFNSWVQVVYYICPACLSIHAACRRA